VSHRNCPESNSKCPGFFSITALVPRFLVSKCLEIGAEVSKSVFMPKCLVAEMSGHLHDSAFYTYGIRYFANMCRIETTLQERLKERSQVK